MTAQRKRKVKVGREEIKFSLALAEDRTILLT